ncbi:aminotransferase class IV [Parvularcula dongshanensis]|uniref:Probable branched-chain-amino-acid aminotransferase n=1 Tax=Parvularcula dongshanensis TaxID=1173995 RepID=A0A840I072_9PROT|nr:branched-chain amino acid aminotransferase [Parvularcula dongshanensis]
MIWADGAVVAEDALVFAANDRGATLGDGLFETLKAVEGRPVFLSDHLERMAASSALLDLPFDEAAARAGVAAVLEGRAGLASVRITLSRGPGPRGTAPIPRAEQRPVLVVASAPMAASPGGPIRLALAATRRNEWSLASRMKTLSYQDMILARAEAARAGADDALVLNTAGRPVCTTIGNLWLRTREGFATPPVGEGVLPGIVRSRLLAAAPSAGIEVEVRPLLMEEVESGTLFRTNSLTGVQPAGLSLPPSSDNPLGRLYDVLEREALS